MSTFQVYQLDSFRWFVEETMGTKARDWYQATSEVPDLKEKTLWLFKAPTRFRGEIWAEKIAAEIGHEMGLPTARVELACSNGSGNEIDGTISLNFVDRDVGHSLEHGNELMEFQKSQDSYHLDEEGQVGLVQDSGNAYAPRRPNSPIPA